MKNGVVMLVGPGGAGKTTVGALLAQRLGIAFADLDRCFSERHGDISQYIQAFGYQQYANTNVETFQSWLLGSPDKAVIALSSGFMTYGGHLGSGYSELRQEIETRQATLVLIPSLDLESCVNETVRRQSLRAFTRGPIREATVIRDRFSVYTSLSTPKVETWRPLSVVVEDCLRALGFHGQERLKKLLI